MAQAAGRQLSSWKPRFNPKPFRVGFVVDKMALGFPPSTSAFPCQYHFTGNPCLFIYLFIYLSIHSTITDSVFSTIVSIIT
jgi:hypothetical protein